MRSEYGEVKRYLLSIISHHILKVIVRQIDAVVHILSSKPIVAQSLRVPVSHQSHLGGDLLFVLRVVVQCMLPGTPPELSVEAETLAEKATSSFPSSGGANGSLLEKCPACGVEIPLRDTASAVCSNGHRWCEASITFNSRPFVFITIIGRQLAALSLHSFWQEPWCAHASAARARLFFLPRDLYIDRKEEGMQRRTWVRRQEVQPKTQSWPRTWTRPAGLYKRF